MGQADGRADNHVLRQAEDPQPGKVRQTPCKRKKMEARVGIEPTHKGFADLSLTTWVPRLAVGFRLRARLNHLPGLMIVGEVYSRQGLFGAGDRGRTGDIFLGKEALYH